MFRMTSTESPGPASHSAADFGKTSTIKSSPAFSIKGRHPSATTRIGPGPGDHHTENGTNAISSQHRSPAWTLQGRAKESTLEQSPGPAAFDGINTTIRKPPAFTMSSRHKDLSEDRHGPAPNAYNANDHSGTKTAPAFSIKGRHNDNLSNIGPGPGALDVTRSLDYSSAVKGTPSFSMSGRAKDLASSNAPGPGAYNSEDAARYKKAPAFSMSGRAKEDAARLGPGPGAYTTPDALSKLSASIKGRPKSSLSTDSPGPAYNVDYGKTVKKSPAFSMTGRARDQRNDQAPGPGTYAVAANPNHKKPPAFSMSGRNKELMDASGPGPGAYNTPDALSKRGASIKGRHEEKSNNHSPGPAYSVDISKTTKGAPSFSMGGRTKDLASSNAPGPGQYSVRDASSGAISFGVRYPDKVGILPE